MITRLSFIAAFVVVGALVSGTTRVAPTAVQAAAQNPGAQGTGQPSQPNAQDMMKMHEQMMAEMKAADAKLDALVLEMNKATGDAKLNAVAAVVNELVRQQKVMHDHMGQMHQRMMGGRRMMMRR